MCVCVCEQDRAGQSRRGAGEGRGGVEQNGGGVEEMRDR